MRRRWAWIIPVGLLVAMTAGLSLAPVAPCPLCQEQHLFKNDEDCSRCRGRRTVTFVNRWFVERPSFP